MSSARSGTSPVWELIMNPPHRSEDHPSYERFQHVLNTISHEGLANYANYTRAKISTNWHIHVLESVILPRVARVPIFGSKNLIYAVEFADSTKWCFKIPGAWRASEWALYKAAALDAEVATMMFVQERTTIPVPRVFASANAKDRPSPIVVPFILVEWIQAYPLNPGWHEGALICETEELRLQKERTVVSLAGYMNQLSRFRFDRGGWITPAPPNMLPQVGGLYVFNELHRVFPWIPRTRYEEPCEDYQSFFLCQLRAWNRGNDRTDRNDYSFAHFLCTHVPNQTARGQRDFVLTYPNLDLSNILIHSDGSIAALPDWSGAAVVPRVIGYEAYPRWLTLDWFWEGARHPGQLLLTEPIRAGLRPPEAPEALIDMRNSWHSSVQGRDYVRSDWDVPQDATRQSLFFGRLWEALRNPEHRHAILLVLFDRIIQAATRQTPDISCYDEQIEALEYSGGENNTRELFERGLANLTNSYVWLI